VTQYFLVDGDISDFDHPENAKCDPVDTDMSITRSESCWDCDHHRIIAHNSNHVEVIRTSRISPFFHGSTFTDERAAQHRPAPFVVTRADVAYFLIENIHFVELPLFGRKGLLGRVTANLANLSGLHYLVTNAVVVLACPCFASDNRAGAGITAIGDTQKAMYRRMALYNIPPLFDIVPGTAALMQATRGGN
jgi:hypothetical protein